MPRSTSRMCFSIMYFSLLKKEKNYHVYVLLLFIDRFTDKVTRARSKVKKKHLTVDLNTSI